MALYRIEFRRVLMSLIALLMIVSAAVYAYTQGVFPPSGVIARPKPGVSDYGTKPSNDPVRIMPEAAKMLFVQYSVNQYTTYPNGFLKYVKLNQADRIKMDGIIAELSAKTTGKPEQESNKKPSGENHEVQIHGDGMQSGGNGSVQIITPDGNEEIDFRLSPDIPWARFSELMAQADQLLGGGSDFSETWMGHRFGQIPVTYEEALADYEQTVSYDKLTGAHARLFSDYMGSLFGLLSVFPAVFLCLRDRKNIAPMLYTRRISSVNFILTRYSALITVTMLPLLLMGVLLTGIHAADYGLANIDVLAYLKYTFFWIMPTVMVSTAMGVFFTTLTHTPVAIMIQLVWWFIDMRGGNGMYSFFGVRPFQLIPRHNQLGNTSAYIDYLPSLTQNRILIAGIAILLVACAICVFEARRRELLNVPGFKLGKIQSEA